MSDQWVKTCIKKAQHLIVHSTKSKPSKLCAVWLLIQDKDAIARLLTRNLIVGLVGATTYADDIDAAYADDVDVAQPILHLIAGVTSLATYLKTSSCSRAPLTWPQ